MRRLHLAIPALLAVAPASISPSARPVRLDWGSLNILMMADPSRGTLIWGSERRGLRDKQPERGFMGYVDPAAAWRWTQDVREFLATPLTTADTGTFRASPVLRSRQGDWIYFIRLKRKDRWVDERFLVMQGASRSEARQLLIEGIERNAIEFIEALEGVNVQTLNMRRSESADSIPIANPADTSNCPTVHGKPPAVKYPRLERERGKDGDVWTSFVVTAAGAVDSSSIEVLLSDGQGFESAVLSALVRTRFKPATRQGTPISMRMYQQFSFRIVGR